MKNILLVVDMQNGFAKCEQTVKLTKKIKELLEKKIFDVVVATRFLNNANSIYEKLFNWKCLELNDERALPESIAKYVDFTIDKSVYTCVNADFIQRLCQMNDGAYPERIFIVGVDTDCCVLVIATSLFEHNIRPVVLTKYCGSNGGPDSHDAGITCMKKLIGEGQLVHKLINKKSDLCDI